MTTIFPLKTMPISDLVRDEIHGMLYGEAVIVYPTDTLYGLGGSAAAPDLAGRVRQLKGRAGQVPFSLLYLSGDRLKEDFKGNRKTLEVFSRFLPGPVTIIVPAPDRYPYSHLASEDGTIGIRYINFEPLGMLLRDFPHPLISTSVNPHGNPPATNRDEILAYFPGKIDLILDYGPMENSRPSTVIRYDNGKLKLVREGVIPFDELLLRTKPL